MSINIVSSDRKIPTKLKKPRKTEQCIFTWIRNRISGIDVGMEIKDESGCHPIHLNSNQTVLRHFERLRNNVRSGIDRINNQDFVDHVAEVSTFYWTGSHESKKNQTLVNIDIDCKKFGTLDGAMAFAKHLKETMFPNLYYETSTHGNGAHGYFVLDKWGYGSSFINKLLLERLDPYLKQLLRDADFDVENVEIKGTLPVLTWGDKKLELIDYTSGCPAKIPRLGSSEKEMALRNTTCVTTHDLMKLPKVESPVANRVNNDFMSLSCTGVPISQQDLDEFPQFVEVADELLNGGVIRMKKCRHVVRAEDVAMMLMLGKCFTNNMNKDGTMPRDRFARVHKILKKNQLVSRGYRNDKHKAIRDFLTSLDLIDWGDASYRASTVVDEDGKGTNGVACKWRYSEKLMEMLDFDIKGGESILGSTPYASIQNDLFEQQEDESFIIDDRDLTVPVRVIDLFDYLLAGEKVDQIVLCWSPIETIAV